jgi:3-oxoacyl-[acyl-carrier-protein] synthase II
MESAPVIASCGAVTALGLGLEPLERALRENTSGLRAGNRFAGKRHQSNVAGYVPEVVLDELRATKPSHADAPAFLLAESALRQAEQGAGDWLKAVPPARRGLVLSTTKADVAALERLVGGHSCSVPARRHVLPGLLATDLAEARGLCGPVECVSVACVSGLLALQLGARWIQRGIADAVFVVGVDLVTDFVMSGFTTLKSLDPEGCRPFDRTRTGLSLGEGAGAILLTRQTRAPSATLNIAGWGSSNDANHLTGPSRDGSGLALAIMRALESAATAPEVIDYVNAHGTGTPYNDAMESLALQSVFGERVPPFSSSKGLLGHTLGAAGVLETMVCVIAAARGLLPGTPRLRERDPAVSAAVLAEPRAGVIPGRMLKINAGFGGTNAALVLARKGL